MATYLEYEKFLASQDEFCRSSQSLRRALISANKLVASSKAWAADLERYKGFDAKLATIVNTKATTETEVNQIIAEADNIIKGLRFRDQFLNLSHSFLLKEIARSPSQLGAKSMHNAKVLAEQIDRVFTYDECMNLRMAIESFLVSIPREAQAMSKLSSLLIELSAIVQHSLHPISSELAVHASFLLKRGPEVQSFDVAENLIADIIRTVAKIKDEQEARTKIEPLFELMNRLRLSNTLGMQLAEQVDTIIGIIRKGGMTISQCQNASETMSRINSLSKIEIEAREKLGPRFIVLENLLSRISTPRKPEDKIYLESASALLSQKGKNLTESECKMYYRMLNEFISEIEKREEARIKRYWNSVFKGALIAVGAIFFAYRLLVFFRIIH